MDSRSFSYNIKYIVRFWVLYFYTVQVAVKCYVKLKVENRRHYVGALSV